MELLGGLGPAWAAKEQKGQKKTLDFDHFGIHFGHILASIWDHFGCLSHRLAVCCGASCCGVLWCVVSCCVAKNAKCAEGIFTVSFMLKFDIARGSDAARKSGEATRRCAEVWCEVTM